MPVALAVAGLVREAPPKRAEDRAEASVELQARLGFTWVYGCGSFRKLGIPYFGVLIIRILLFGVLY